MRKDGYEIVTAGSHATLPREVRAFVEQKKWKGETWQPEGGFTNLGNGVGQAMVRIKE